MQERQSLAFDRAADYYDATRSMTPEAHIEVSRLLAAELHGRGPVLEVGVGTGRIGLSLFQEGVEMTGIDLSEPMLRRLVENAGGSLPFPLCRADATEIPLADNTFGAVLTCHVLHLIPAWEKALAEFARVLVPGGVYLNDLGGWHQITGPRIELMKRFAAEAGFGLTARGANDVDAVEGALSMLGATPRPLATVSLEESSTYEKSIEDLENGIWSCTWETPKEARRAAAAAVRPWAAGRYGDLSARYLYSVPITWMAYDLP